MIIFSSLGMLLREWISVEVGRVDSWWVYGDSGRKLSGKKERGRV